MSLWEQARSVKVPGSPFAEACELVAVGGPV
jgi:hypothetical protein